MCRESRQSDPPTRVSLTCKSRAKIPRVSMIVQTVGVRQWRRRRTKRRTSSGSSGRRVATRGWALPRTQERGAEREARCINYQR
ncbi:hypothetical protein PUN28_011668 [Cardiocondyla obscurior]|uniref:Uncharacterized protein n=1 Tax=Cardiocondyla obscurior TaxID=286306 RepID=A0AAW2FEZ7_9HYME